MTSLNDTTLTKVTYGKYAEQLCIYYSGLYNAYYYMEESVLLGTKPLVDSIRHYIRDPSGVFSVCHLCVVSFNDVTIPAFFIKPSRICKT